ncbi:MAG: MarR family EPS-associated transcriptional regulator [Chromatiales bacterium]|jgi:EPS-associated MarR family transcriptional regulator|nr:MarR family EPS-associated transcriptional regulator [Chromatiales bacterium]
MLDDATRYRLLTLLQENPELSQRDLAERVGISLGKANYCLRALIDRGWVKIHNFRNSSNKSAYLYKLTPAGLNEKIQVTRRFLAHKVREHADLTAEIERLRCEVESQNRDDGESDGEPLESANSLTHQSASQSNKN